MTEEEKQELEALRAKENLDEEEQLRLKELEDLALRDTATEEDDDEFDKAFDEAVAEDDPDRDAAIKEDSEKDKEKGSEEDQKKDDDASGEEDSKGKTVFKQTPAKDSDGEGDTDQGDTDWEAKFKETDEENKKLTQKMKSWEGRITAANKRAEEAESKLQETEEQSTQEKSKAKKKAESLPDGDDDDEVLKEFIEEFPSLERPIKALAMRMAKQVVESKLKEFEPKFQKIDEIEQSLDEDVNEKHFNLITEAHEDWEDIVASDEFKNWIEAQPSFVKASLERVVKEGTAKEVIEMFDSYKETMGVPKKTSKSQKQSSKSQKKAKDLAAVESSPSKVNTQAGKKDKDDFDSAWDEAMADEK